MKSISISELQKIDNKIVIDVREVAEVKSGGYPGAINLPLSILPVKYGDVLDKSQTYYILCQGGGRSAQACMYLANLGYDVVNVQGGYMAYISTI